MEPSDAGDDERDAQVEANFRTQAADLYRYIYRQVRQPAIAEDLTSAVFLKALRWLRHDRSHQSARGWLYATARSLIADYWRTHAQLPLLPLEAAEELPLRPDTSAEQFASLHTRIQRLLDGLPARERDILTLRYLQGYSAAEIGELFGLSPNHVRVLQFRALRRAAVLEAQEGSVPVASPTLPYTDHALRALALAKEEARAFQHSYVGTEHLLLGILREGSAPAAAELNTHGVTVENMRTGVTFILGRMAAARRGPTQPASPEPPMVEPDFTRRAAQVLALAGEEAQRLGAPAISPQHLLVAILREGEGIAAMLLQVSGVRWEQVGDTVQISVIPDDEGKPVAVPADLQAALQPHPDEQRLFEKMSALKQRQLIEQLEYAEGDAARAQAVARVVELLQQARQSHLRSQPKPERPGT
jgi:RNA polymerase sigma factor (sigma-70 family)